MPTVSSHLPEDWDLKAEFDSLVEKEYRGKPGPYIRELIERDLRNEAPKTNAPKIIETLCAALRPDLVSTLSAQFANAGVNQPALLGRVLEAIAYLGSREPLALRAGAFHLVGSGEVTHFVASVLFKEKNDAIEAARSIAPDVVGALTGSTGAAKAAPAGGIQAKQPPERYTGQKSSQPQADAMAGKGKATAKGKPAQKSADEKAS